MLRAEGKSPKAEETTNAETGKKQTKNQGLQN